MWLGKTLMLAMVITSVGTILLYQIPAGVAWKTIWKGATSWTTIQPLLVFYTITFLQRMMEKRKDLSNCQIAMNGLFNNRRINVSIVPFLLGCLPAASTVLICGPIVRDSVGNYLAADEKAAITSYFRHISESFLPTYTTIFIALELTNGAVSASSFILTMLPMVILLFFTGYIIYLRKIPKDTGMKSDLPKRYYWELLVKSVWCIALAIAIILIFHLPVYIAVFICITFNFFVNKFSFLEVQPFFRTAFEKRLMLSTWLVMIFKEILGATGVINKLPQFFSLLPIPTYMLFSLIFFLGTVVAGSQAMIVLCMPMVMASLNGGNVLPMFILLMCMNYIAMQLSPVHICLTMCAEDYRISLGQLIIKTMPMVIVFSAFSFMYYFFLTGLSFKW
ncbi:DUF401 family protein [Pyramidobacter sp. SM-530-WT-4B]|uniref:DUF401 family protein n=2 Tax=Pyramidobacter porci TaxID=2605789 RepID=A0A6L5YC16_9BACT|nr:DUF401 family protein [Pyramidobacter porci]